MVTAWLTSKKNPKSQNISNKAGRVLARVIQNSCNGLRKRWLSLKVTVKLYCQRDMNLKIIKLQVRDNKSVSQRFSFSFFLLVVYSVVVGKARVWNFYARSSDIILWQPVVASWNVVCFLRLSHALVHLDRSHVIPFKSPFSSARLQYV